MNRLSGEIEAPGGVVSFYNITRQQLAGVDAALEALQEEPDGLNPGTVELDLVPGFGNSSAHIGVSLRLYNARLEGEVLAAIRGALNL